MKADLPAAIADVDALWGSDWPHDVTVVVTASADEFAGLARTTANDVAAVTVWDGDKPSVVFAPDAGTRLTVPTRRVVLRHEITHVATHSATAPGSPLWLLEGFADYSGYRTSGLDFARIAPTLRRTPERVVLPTDAEFASSAVLAYEKAWSACQFIADRFGIDVLIRLYRALAHGHADAAQTDTALRTTLGIGTDEFTTGWNDWLADRRESATPR